MACCLCSLDCLRARLTDFKKYFEYDECFEEKDKLVRNYLRITYETKYFNASIHFSTSMHISYSLDFPTKILMII